LLALLSTVLLVSRALSASTLAHRLKLLSSQLSKLQLKAHNQRS
jgi:hypothetical protein